MCITLTYFTLLPEGGSMFREKLCLDFSVHSEDVDTQKQKCRMQLILNITVDDNSERIRLKEQTFLQGYHFTFH